MNMAIPGGPMEICFSFDTTGSMGACINEVKGKVQDLIQRLQADIPGIRMAVFAHGDYCDKHNYITKHIDFSTDVTKLCNWVKTVGTTGGGDGDECYELVLQEVQSLSWTPGSKRALVMIGDADPHEPGYNYGGKTYNIDWRDETYKLLMMNIRIYGVQCGYYGSSKDFYNKMTQATDGKCLKLADFANMFDFMMAICYREHDETLLQNYETEVRARGTTINKDLEALFGKLRRADTEVMDTSPSVPTALTKIPSLTKPSSVKMLKPSLKTTVKTTRKPRTTRFRSKHERLLDRRNEERLEKYKLKNLPKLKRENVPETNFMLNDAPWSKWQLAVTQTLPEGTESDLWEKRRGDLTGFRRKEICDGQYQKPALYEFAVQTAEHCKRYVVYCKCNKGFMLDKGSWESRLLNTPNVRTEVEDVLKKGFRLFVRRFPLKKTCATSNKMTDLGHYDYAWRGQRKERTSPRFVEYKL
ncbi:uncharacterized protein LOC127725398 [Mytilus californianus]|uniref:uncharacterized protein LOC127725398 n=1 Tax=Mytilus californianus TaxID=6549 RepID=UPI0022472A04|nr:uncharacterized protein LOC127725398 [Mytilus californianus]